MKKSVLIDLDDTLSLFLDSWLSLYNKKYNDNLTVMDILSWNIQDYIKPEAREDIYELLKTPGLLSEVVKPKPGAIMVTEILSKYYDLYIVTACTYPQNIVEKFKWIENYFPHISTDNIITAKNKSLIKGDYMIDDYQNNLITSICDTKLLFNMPHNFNYTIEFDSMTRVSNWEEVLWFFAEENVELSEEVIEITTNGYASDATKSLGKPGYIYLPVHKMKNFLNKYM